MNSHSRQQTIRGVTPSPAAPRRAPGLGLLEYDPFSGDWVDDGTGSITGNVSVTSQPGQIPYEAPASVSWLPSANEIVSLVKGIGGAVMTYEQAKAIQEINLQRAKSNQPLLTPYQMQQLQPQVGVNVGLSAQTKQYLLYGALGLGAVFLLTNFGGGASRGRRR